MTCSFCGAKESKFFVLSPTDQFLNSCICFNCICVCVQIMIDKTVLTQDSTGRFVGPTASMVGVG